MGILMVASQGLEPQQAESESAVLPLHHEAIALLFRLAGSTGLEVFAGPVEGTAIGNLIVQMIAGGEFADLAAARAAIA